MKTGITVIKAKYLHDYVVRVAFNDGKVNDIDFADPFAELRGYYARFRKHAAFKRFKIEDGNLTWGPDAAVIFPVDQLYRGKIAKAKPANIKYAKKILTFAGA